MAASGLRRVGQKKSSGNNSVAQSRLASSSAPGGIQETALLMELMHRLLQSWHEMEPLWFRFVRLVSVEGDLENSVAYKKDQDRVLARWPTKQLAICEIGERAHDARREDALKVELLETARQRRAGVDLLIRWLKQAPAIEEYLKIRFRAISRTPDAPAAIAVLEAVREISKKVPEIRRLFYIDESDVKYPKDPKDATYRMPRAGRRPRPWVADADRALRRLGLSRADRDFLLAAWRIRNS